MRAFRLTDGTENELIFGVDNSINNATLGKLKKGLARIKPFEQVVPYYKNSKFAFISFNAFKYFLFGLCDFSYEDLIELERLGYKVIDEDLSCYSRGLSKLICTYFDDEVVELKTELLSKLFENADLKDYKVVTLDVGPDKFIKECRNQFYRSVPFIK